MGQLDISSGLSSHNSTKCKSEQKHSCCSTLKKCDSGSSDTTFQCSVTVHREMSQ